MCISPQSDSSLVSIDIVNFGSILQTVTHRCATAIGDDEEYGRGTGQSGWRATARIQSIPRGPGTNMSRLIGAKTST